MKRRRQQSQKKQKTVTRTFLLVNSCIWKETEQKDASQESMRLCNWDKKEIYTKKEKSISVVKERKRKGTQVHTRTIEERVY